MPAESPRPFHLFHDYEVPPDTAVVRLLGVDYLHIKTPDNGDLYLTRYGAPFLENLKPENWYAGDWFAQNREKLEGTSTVYRVRTRPVNGRQKDLVVKWCRVGEDVPADTFMLIKFASAEFNTPYEEFSLAMEMRDDRTHGIIRTHKPLGIFVPPERLELWQTGRSTSIIARKKAKFRDLELDICRQYIMIYEWIKGVSVVEAYRDTLPPDKLSSALASITGEVNQRLELSGYRVLDMKPVHVIVRKDKKGGVIRDRNHGLRYALVDFELLERTPGHEEKILSQRRAEYLKRQEGRFFITYPKDYPAHLHHMNIFGVDYVFGGTESTRGTLWVVGKDPALFDYFLPERWRRTPRTRLSATREIYHTRTKDNIHLVWKVSNVGEVPDTESAASYGYNSPFEEFAIALELSNLGLRTIFPRAIYMTGRKRSEENAPQDGGRYESHQSVLMHDGTRVLRQDHNYITVWGYWVGPIREKARQDEIYNKGMNLLDGFRSGRVDEATFNRLMERKQALLARAGFEDLKMKGDHLLLSVNADGSLIIDKAGLPEVRLCNFEFIRRIKNS
jgi:hypothetical protein